MGGSKYIVVLAFLTASFSSWGQQDFIATFNTEAGDSQNNTIVLPVYDGTYNVEIDVDGDGVYEHTDASSKSLVNLVGLQTITFSTPGVYQVRIYPGSYNYGKQLRMAFDDTDSAQKLIRIDHWGTNINWTSMRNAFNGCTNLSIAASAGDPNLSGVTDMAFMFANATSLHEEDLSRWNVSNVTNMRGTFLNARSFNGNISTWNVANVTNTEQMFDGATAFNGNLNDWNINKMSNMTRMFQNASSFNQDLDRWNVSNVQNFRYMFYGASSFNRSIGNWNTQRATTMSHMFFNATKFNQDIGNWHFPNVHNMTSFLSGASNFSIQNYDKLLIGWSTLNTQSGLNFGAPPTNYCNGADARAKLIRDHYWNITGDTGYGCPLPELLVDIKVFLQGAHHESSGMMRDDLRAHIPTTSPYTDGATIKPEVLDVDGNDAIVDWVFVELRDKSDISKMVYTTSALLQRDGDIVGLDGTSVLAIIAAADDYYIAVKHRNHIPVATDKKINLSTTTTHIDFTNASIIRGGISAVVEIGNGVHALLCGDMDGNNQIQLSDYIMALGTVGQSGYKIGDINMDGQVQLSDVLNILAKHIGRGKRF